MDDRVKTVEYKIKDYGSIKKSVLENVIAELSDVSGVLDCKADDANESIKYLIAESASDYDIFSALVSICDKNGIELLFGETLSGDEDSVENVEEGVEESDGEDDLSEKDEEEKKSKKEKRYDKVENIILLSLSAVLTVLGFVFEKSNANASMWIFMFGYALAGYETLYSMISDIVDKKYAAEKGMVLASSFIVLYFGFRLLGCAVIFFYSLISFLYSVLSDYNENLKENGYNDEEIKAITDKIVVDKKRLFTYDMILLGIGVLLVFIPPIFKANQYWSTLTNKWLCVGASMIFFGVLSNYINSVRKCFLFARVFAMKNGVKIDSDESVAKTSAVKKVCFDKTGVITSEIGKVIKVETENEQKLSEYVAAAESDLSDSIAKTLNEYFKNVTPVVVDEKTYVEGRGVTLKAGDKIVLVGSKKFLNKNGVKTDDKTENSAVYVTENGELIGKIEINFEINENSYGAITELKEDSSIESELLSADSIEIVDCVKTAVGFASAVSGATSEFKAERAEKSGALYVGNADSDEETIKKAVLSIALGAKDGFENEGFASKSSDLKIVPTLVKLSARTMKICKQNKISAIVSRVLFFAAGVLLTVLTPYRLWMFWAVIGASVCDIAALFNDCRNLTEVV